jgi:hypothetical protein
MFERAVAFIEGMGWSLVAGSPRPRRLDTRPKEHDS